MASVAPLLTPSMVMRMMRVIRVIKVIKMIRVIRVSPPMVPSLAPSTTLNIFQNLSEQN